MHDLPTIESGKIRSDRPLKDILLSITHGRKAEFALFKAVGEKADGATVDGEMLIIGSKTIEGARLHETDGSINAEPGREALKAILAIESGTYSLLDLTTLAASSNAVPMPVLHQELAVAIADVIAFGIKDENAKNAENAADASDAKTNDKSNYYHNEHPAFKIGTIAALLLMVISVIAAVFFGKPH
jgi:hypothetical protein